MTKDEKLFCHRYTQIKHGLENDEDIAPIKEARRKKLDRITG